MSYLRIENATKTFGASPVLDHLDLQVEQGELLTLLGPSGCGKSTLLRCISGLTDMEDGDIYLEQQRITSKLPKDRGVGMVFQAYGLFPNMSVGDNVAFGLRMQRMGKADIVSRTEEMLRLVGLEDKIKAYPHQLSGGQQQRVALARSLAVRPKLMLMDEPLSALDAKIRKTLRLELRRIQKDLGMTTIFVTHDQEEALTMSDRVCVMHEGRIVQMGTPEEIYTEPRNEFVARFIGNYNVLSAADLARLTGRGDWQPGSYALRPESIRLGRHAADVQLSGGAGDSLHLRGRIADVIVLGNVLRFQVEAGGLTLSVDSLNGTERQGLAPGAEAELAFPREACRLLEGSRG